MSENLLDIYKRELVRWNKAINIVSPKTIDDIDTRHIKDSAQLSTYIPHGATIMDWGSGGGLPAMVLALTRPDITVHMVESDQKKCEFLRHVSRETKRAVFVHTKRIEELMLAEEPDIVTARALAPLDKLLGWMRLYDLHEGLFLKGEQWQLEIQEAQKVYNFDVTTYPSVTDKKARIIHIKNLT